MNTACAVYKIEPRPEKLAPFTAELLAQQPDDAFVSVYSVGEKRLIWMGAKHSTQTNSLTFQLILDAYDRFAIDTVIVEGLLTSEGSNSEVLIDYARAEAAKENDGFQPGGETVPSVLGALEAGATLFGGEPEDSDILRRALQQGLSEDDLLGFYTMRSIPQWIRERQISDASDPQIEPLLTEELERNRTRLGLSDSVLPDVDTWREWYEATNGKPLAADFVTEEAGPRADGRFGTNLTGAAISKARAAHLHEFTVSQLNADKTVMVVFGASHLMIHRPALDSALGEPCYSGSDFDEAMPACFN